MDGVLRDWEGQRSRVVNFIFGDPFSVRCRYRAPTLCDRNGGAVLGVQIQDFGVCECRIGMAKLGRFQWANSIYVACIDVVSFGLLD